MAPPSNRKTNGRTNFARYALARLSHNNASRAAVIQAVIPTGPLTTHTRVVLGREDKALTELTRDDALLLLQEIKAMQQAYGMAAGERPIKIGCNDEKEVVVVQALKALNDRVRANLPAPLYSSSHCIDDTDHLGCADGYLVFSRDVPHGAAPAGEQPVSRSADSKLGSLSLRDFSKVSVFDIIGRGTECHDLRHNPFLRKDVRNAECKCSCIAVMRKCGKFAENDLSLFFFQTHGGILNGELHLTFLAPSSVGDWREEKCPYGTEGCTPYIRVEDVVKELDKLNRKIFASFYCCHTVLDGIEMIPTAYDRSRTCTPNVASLFGVLYGHKYFARPADKLRAQHDYPEPNGPL